MGESRCFCSSGLYSFSLLLVCSRSLRCLPLETLELLDLYGKPSDGRRPSWDDPPIDETHAPKGLVFPEVDTDGRACHVTAQVSSPKYYAPPG